MCGIIGYAGTGSAAPLLLAGLKRLEYRGYDSAGIAINNGTGSIKVLKKAGRVEGLAEPVRDLAYPGDAGIAHTRWATHGPVTDANAHPHVDGAGNVAVVHNGIIENYMSLREELAAAGCHFSSDTDSEVLCHLIAQRLGRGESLLEAVRHAGSRIDGAAAVVTMAASEPGVIVGLRLGNAGGILVGYGDDGNYVASDLVALLPHTNRVTYLESGETVRITVDGVDFFNNAGTRITRDVTVTERSYESAQLGAYPHFMAKEIAEQPEAVAAAMRDRLDFERGTVRLEGFTVSDSELAQINRVILTGMGTSLHAAMVGAAQIERLARIPASAENSSELRYREPALDENTLIIAVTQSGETADTLAAMELAKKSGCRLIAVVEAEGTQATRLAEHTLPVYAGQEIGVAATKTMTATMVTLLELALYLGAHRGTLSEADQREAVEALGTLPGLVGRTLDNGHAIPELARHIADYDHLLYLGRGDLYPSAMEGALKMKEIAYIHAEGYAAGEMKHGVNALISEHMPTIVVAPQGPLLDKMISNINEVKARGGEVIAIATEGDAAVHSLADSTIDIPDAPAILLPVLTVFPLQQLAYHTAVVRGHDPDKPRNLAKTVTVE